MLFMVIERFKNRDAKAVYGRFREQGRGAPRGALLRGQLDRGELRPLLSAHGMRGRASPAAVVVFWSDLIEFEIVPVVSSAETREAIEPLLYGASGTREGAS
jgi:hypothetical protein